MIEDARGRIDFEARGAGAIWLDMILCHPSAARRFLD
jgi:hypothetical protein